MWRRANSTLAFGDRFTKPNGRFVRPHVTRRQAPLLRRDVNNSTHCTAQVQSSATLGFASDGSRRQNAGFGQERRYTLLGQYSAGTYGNYHHHPPPQPQINRRQHQVRASNRVGMGPYDVFLSHAGEQKKDFVDCLNTILGNMAGSNISAFLDEDSLRSGEAESWGTILTAAQTCRIAVVVLSHEFLCKECPMAELECFLKRQQKELERKKVDKDSYKPEFIVIPVLYSLEYEQCSREGIAELYKKENWPPGVQLVEDPATLTKWAGLVEELLGTTAHRADQTNFREGKLAEQVADAVVRWLVKMEVLPAGFRRSNVFAWDRVLLQETTQHMVGRREEVQRVVNGLCGKAGAAVLWGGPGEGKSTVAMRAGLEFCIRGGCSGGAFVVDFEGCSEKLKSLSLQDIFATTLRTQFQLCKDLPQPASGSWQDVLGWLRATAPGPVLLVLENVEEVAWGTEAGESSSQLGPLLEELQQLAAYDGLKRVFMIINSRMALLSSRLDGAPFIPLQALQAEDAEWLLVELSGKHHHWKWEEGQANKLVNLCGCNAFAVTLVASFLNQQRCQSPKAAIERYEAFRHIIKVPQPSRRAAATDNQFMERKRLTWAWMKSYLLSDELEAVAALSVIPGTFTVEAATAVGVTVLQNSTDSEAAALWDELPSRAQNSSLAETGDVHEVSGLLQDLASMSVLHQKSNATEDSTRYGMHPLIREMGAAERERVYQAIDGGGDQQQRAQRDSIDVRRVETRLVMWMLLNPMGPGQMLVASDPLRMEASHPVRMVASDPLRHEHSSTAWRSGVGPQLIGNEAANFVEVSRLLRLLPGLKWTKAHMDRCEAVAQALISFGHASHAQLLLEALVFCDESWLGVKGASTGVILCLATACCEQGNFAKARHLQTQLLGLLNRQLGMEDPETLLCMDNLSTTLWLQGELSAARELQAAVLAARKRLLGPEHRGTLSSMNNLALILSHQGELAAARELHEAVLDVHKRVLPPDHPDILTTMSNLACILLEQGELSEARVLQEAVLAGQKRLLGPEHPATLTSIGNLANTLRNQDELSAARELEEGVLVVSKKVLGPEHPDTLRSMNNLADTLSRQGELSAARVLEEAVLDVCKRVLGPEHPHTLTIMHNLASTLRQQGELSAACKLEQSVLDASKKVLGLEHPQTLTSIASLAGILKQQGELSAARELEKELLDAEKGVLGPEHPAILTYMTNLATTLKQQGELPAARELEEEVLDISKRVLGREHPAIVTFKMNLVVTLKRQGELSAACELEEEILAFMKNFLGSQDPITLTCMNNLADTLSMQGELSAARELAEASLNASTEVLGAEHPTTLTSMNTLAAILLHQGELSAARELAEEVLAAGNMAALGAEHPAILTGMNNLASALLLQGELSAARELQEQVLVTMKRAVGPEHPHTLTSMHNLASTLFQQGELSAARDLEEAVLVARGGTGCKEPNAGS